MNGFLEQYTQGPAHPRRGYKLKASISAVVKRDVHGQTGYEICFWPHADPDERSAILEGIRSSAVVDRILEGDEAKEALSHRELEGLPNRLVVVFQKDTDLRDVYDFQERHIFLPSPHPIRRELRPEIKVMQDIVVESHLAYEIGFWPNVTAEQVATIRDEMAESPLVYRIFENVDPETIVLE